MARDFYVSRTGYNTGILTYLGQYTGPTGWGLISWYWGARPRAPNTERANPNPDAIAGRP
eukprot:scaffold23618_cov23-Cyclotella_meneghiniana.AAC.2